MSADDNITLTDEQKELLHKLNPRQQKFVCNLVRGMNQTQAYKAAGYKPKSDDNAGVMAVQLLGNIKVKAAYDALCKPSAEKQASGAILTRERALEILTRQAECTLDQVVEMQDAVVDTPDGPITQTFMRIKDSNNLSPVAKASIKAVTITNQGPKVELQDRHSAIKLIGQMQGWDKPSEKDNAQNEAMAGFLDMLNGNNIRPKHD